MFDGLIAACTPEQIKRDEEYAKKWWARHGFERLASPLTEHHQRPGRLEWLPTVIYRGCTKRSRAKDLAYGTLSKPRTLAYRASIMTSTGLQPIGRWDYVGRDLKGPLIDYVTWDWSGRDSRAFVYKLGPCVNLAQRVARAELEHVIGELHAKKKALRLATDNRHPTVLEHAPPEPPPSDIYC
jgi:hypothetical protein